MPYLHLDLPVAVAPADRAEIALGLAHAYARVMETNPERVTVAFRELGENGVVRIGPDGALETVVMVNCDVRRGRPPEQRERLGDAVAGPARGRARLAAAPDDPRVHRARGRRGLALDRPRDGLVARGGGGHVRRGHGERGRAGAPLRAAACLRGRHR